MAKDDERSKSDEDDEAGAKDADTRAPDDDERETAGDDDEGEDEAEEKEEKKPARASDKKPERKAEPKREGQKRVQESERRGPSGFIWLAVIAAGLLAGWWYFSGRSADTEAKREPAPTRTESPAAARTETPPPTPPAQTAEAPRELVAPAAAPASAAAPAPTAEPSAKPAATAKDKAAKAPEPETAPATTGGGEGFDRAAALKALAKAGTTAAKCRMRGEPAGTAEVAVTFQPTGQPSETRMVSGPFIGTPTGKCIMEKLGTVTVPAFSGSAATVVAPVNVH